MSVNFVFCCGNKIEKLFYFNLGAGTESVPRRGLCYQLWKSREALDALLLEDANSSRRGRKTRLLQTQSWPVCFDCQPKILCGLWVVWISPGRPGLLWQNSQGQARLSSFCPQEKDFDYAKMLFVSSIPKAAAPSAARLDGSAFFLKPLQVIWLLKPQRNSWWCLHLGETYFILIRVLADGGTWPACLEFRSYVGLDLVNM